MPVIDDRGRLFGKLNVLDAVFVVVLLLLIPLGYVAYRLFRTPPPEITAVAPDTVDQKDLKDYHRLTLSGRNFRAYLRAAVGTTMAEKFLVASPSTAEIEVRGLGPGTYDVALFDASLEVARKRAAITVLAPPGAPPPPPPPPVVEQPRPGYGLVTALGTFLELEQRDVGNLARGRRLMEGERAIVAEIAATRPAEPAVWPIRTGEGAVVWAPIAGKFQVPAIVSLRCLPVPNDCQVGGTSVLAGNTIRLPKPNGTVAFRIRELRPAGSPVVFPESAVADVQVRFVVRSQVLPLLQVGLKDIDRRDQGPGPPLRATVVSLGRPSEVDSRTSVNVGLDAPPNALSFYEVSDRIAFLEVRLRVPVEKSLDDWYYKGVPVKIGAPLTFESALFVIRGSILQVTIGNSHETSSPSIP